MEGVLWYEIGGYLVQFAGLALGLSIRIVQDDDVAGRASVLPPVGVEGGALVWLVHTERGGQGRGGQGRGGQGRGHFLAAEQVRYGSDLLAVLLVEAAIRVRQPGTARPFGTLTEPYLW
jgi:hypothetical protein